MRHATVYRGAQPVLRDLSLVIAPGCSTVILGPNGCGKSTLLKVFSRELYPVVGPDRYVRLMGQQTWNVWELRTQLGIDSADMQQAYPGRTPGMEIILSGFFSSVDIYAHQVINLRQRTRSSEMMKKLGIAHLRDRPFGEMSAGEKRRALLGRALVQEPHTLVLDEPTTGLDVQACFQYLEIIRNFIREGGTVILVTNHVHEIPPEVGRVVLLKQGRIVEDGSKRDVLNGHSLSALFNTQVELLHHQGWFQVVPALQDKNLTMNKERDAGHQGKKRRFDHAGIGRTPATRRSPQQVVILSRRQRIWARVDDVTAWRDSSWTFGLSPAEWLRMTRLFRMTKAPGTCSICSMRSIHPVLTAQ
jgi:iron complex transport system ATP-binding protein